MLNIGGPGGPAYWDCEGKFGKGLCWGRLGGGPIGMRGGPNPGSPFVVGNPPGNRITKFILEKNYEKRS